MLNPVTELNLIFAGLLQERKALDLELHKVATKLRSLESNQRSGVVGKMMFPIVRDFNCTVGFNVLPGEAEGIIGKVHEHFDTPDIFSILVAAGCFPSKGEARRNWRGLQIIPEGYTELGPIGKQKLHIFIWNPSAI